MQYGLGVLYIKTTQGFYSCDCIMLQSTGYPLFKYILLTKREGRTGGISARGLDSTDLAALGPYKKDRGPIFSQYGPEQAWLIRDLLHD